MDLKPLLLGRIGWISIKADSFDKCVFTVRKTFKKESPQLTKKSSVILVNQILRGKASNLAPKGLHFRIIEGGEF